MGYKDIPSGNIRDCLYADTDYTEWYVDKYGDLRADATHHDGTNHYLYRVFKDGVSETQMENLRDKIYHGKATRADITRLTRRLGDEIAAVYGFDIPKQQPFRWPAGTYVSNSKFDHIMMAMETSITKDGVTYKEVAGTPAEQEELEKSYEHLCKLRDLS